MRHSITSPIELVEMLASEGYAFDEQGAWLIVGDRPSRAELKGDGPAEMIITAIVPCDSPESMAEAISNYGDGKHVCFFAHNHDTAREDGSHEAPEITKHDIDMTIGLIGICLLNQLPLLDHCIIGSNGEVFSMANSGVLLLCTTEAVRRNADSLQRLGITELLGIGNSELSALEKDLGVERQAPIGKKKPPQKPLGENMLDAINQRRAQEGKPPLPPQ